MGGRSIGKAIKFSRREGKELYLKTKPFKEKTNKGDRKPGQHGAKTLRLSNYAGQLREKQKIKRIYGVTERQFRNYYLKAARKKGETGVILLEMLESRLDNIVYRAGLGVTRPEARQLVSHGAILVDGKKVNIASYQVKPGAVISVHEKAKNQLRISGSLALHAERAVSEWIETDANAKVATYKRLPMRSELPADYNEHLIVELYSK